MQTKSHQIAMTTVPYAMNGAEKDERWLEGKGFVGHGALLTIIVNFSFQLSWRKARRSQYPVSAIPLSTLIGTKDKVPSSNPTEVSNSHG